MPQTPATIREAGHDAQRKCQPGSITNARIDAAASAAPVPNPAVDTLAKTTVGPALAKMSSSEPASLGLPKSHGALRFIANIWGNTAAHSFLPQRSTLALRAYWD
jgi:hypothetical protein